MPRVLISVPDKQAQPYRFPLDRKKVTLGRGEDNNIPMATGSVSTHHAVMARVPGGFELRDLDSTNGITCEGEKKIFLPLKSGMKVKIGSVGFEFQLTDEEKEELAKELEPEESTATTKLDEDGKPEGEDEEKPRKKEEKPRKRRKSAPSRKPKDDYVPPAPVPSDSNNGATIGFIILALIAFFIGMAIRYERETGNPLINTILSQ